MYCFDRPTYQVTTVNKTDADYPRSLLKLKDDAPSTLYCIGNRTLLSQPKAAIIGTDNMDMMATIRTDKMLRDISNDYSIMNMASEGIEYYSLATARNTNHKTVMLLEGTYNIDSPDYDDVKPMIDDVIRDGGLVISMYDDNEPYIDQYYNHNHILVMLADVIGCPQYNRKCCDVVNYARKFKKEVIDY